MDEKFQIQSRKVKPAAAAGKKKENKESKEAKEGKESKDSKETKESNANSNEEKETVNGKPTKEEKRTAARDKKKLASSNESLNVSRNLEIVFFSLLIISIVHGKVMNSARF